MLLENMLPYLVVKWNLAWIAVCAIRKWKRPRICADDIELREVVGGIIAKINAA
jgi:hypothetical protein